MPTDGRLSAPNTTKGRTGLSPRSQPPPNVPTIMPRLHRRCTNPRARPCSDELHDSRTRLVIVVDMPQSAAVRTTPTAKIDDADIGANAANALTAAISV